MSAPANWETNTDNLTPDFNPDGTALASPPIGAGIRYYIFSFTTTNTTSINAYMTGNSWAGAEEVIQAIYLESDINKTNLINLTNITNVQFNVTVGTNTQGNGIAISSAFNGFAFRIINLQQNTKYLVVTKTTHNDPGTDIGIYMDSIQTSTKIPVSYLETTAIEPIINITGLPSWAPLVTNVIPDTNPNGSALTNPIVGSSNQRLFKFTFTPSNTTSVNVYIITNSVSATQDQFYRLYQDGQFNTILDGNNLSNLQAGITLNSGQKFITVANNYSNLAFTMYNLTSNISYAIITRATFNNAGIDMGFYLESVASSNQIPLTYVQTSSNTSIYQPTVPANPETPYVTLNSFTTNGDGSGEILGLNPDANPPLLSYPLILYHNVAFQYGSYRLRWNNQSNTVSIIDGSPSVVFSYNSNLGRYICSSDIYSRPIVGNIWFTAPLATVTLLNLTILSGITYDNDINTIDALSYPITLFDNVDYRFNSDTYTLRYIANINEIYFYINTTLTLKFNYNNTTKVWNIYYDVNNRANLLNNTVFFITSETNVTYPPPSGWQSSVVSLIPDTEPDTTPFTLGAGIRYFVFSFSTGVSPRFSCFITSLASSLTSDSIVSLYKSGSTTNIINSTYVKNIQSNVTLDSTEQTLTIGNSFDGLAFELENLDTSSTYFIITKTINNLSGADIGLFLQSKLDASVPSITYVSTTTAPILYKNSFYTTTNIIPDTNPEASPLANPALDEAGDRFYRFSFTTPNTTSITFYFTSESNQESIVYVFKENFIANLLTPNNLTNIKSVVTYDSNTLSISINNSIYGKEGFTVNNLLPNTTYYFFSKTTFNSSGSDVGLAVLSRDTDTFISPITYEATENTQSGVQFPPTLPDTPPISIRPDADDSQITFYWSYPLTDGYAPITSYLLSSISHSCNILIDANVNTNGEYTLSNLTNNTEYSFQIAASNSVGLSPFSQYRSVAPGSLPLPMEISTIELTPTGDVTINAILNSTINTPPIKYIIYTSLPQGQSRLNLSNIQSNIFTTNQSTSMFRLNSNLNWNIYATCVTDVGYSDEVVKSAVFPAAPIPVIEDPESSFFRTTTNQSNIFYLYRSTIQMLDSVLPPVSEWTWNQWKQNAFGFGVLLRNVANTALYRCQYINKLGETLNTSPTFFVSGTASNFFGPTDGSIMYGLYQSTPQFMNYTVFEFSTNTLVISTIDGASTLGLTFSFGRLLSNFAFFTRSTTTLANISNIYKFEVNANNTNTYHPIFVDTAGTIASTSNIVNRNFYYITRPSGAISGIFNKIHCFNSSTPSITFDITSNNINILGGLGAQSPNILNIIDTTLGKNIVYDFNLPQGSNPILSNSIPLGPAITTTTTAYAPHLAGNNTQLLNFRFTSTINSINTLISFGPASSTRLSNQVLNVTYTTGQSATFNAILFNNLNSNISFAVADITGGLNTYNTNIPNAYATRTIQYSNANTIVFRLFNSSQALSTLLYTFQYSNSTIYHYSTMISSATGILLTTGASNINHNYITLSNSTILYLTPGSPPSSLGIKANIVRSLLPLNETTMAFNSFNGQVNIFSNATIISTITLPSNYTNTTLNNLIATVPSKDAFFIFTRNTTSFLYSAYRISTNGLLTSASNADFAFQMSNIAYFNFTSGTRFGALTNLDNNSISGTLSYNWATNSFTMFSNFFYGISNLNTYSNATNTF